MRTPEELHTHLSPGCVADHGRLIALGDHVVAVVLPRTDLRSEDLARDMKERARKLLFVLKRGREEFVFFIVSLPMDSDGCIDYYNV